MNAFRLIWDGKEGWFLVEKSPFTAANDPKSWADLVIVSVDKSMIINPVYRSSVIEDVLKEVT